MTSRDYAERADQLLTVPDIAGRIGAHEQTVRGWIHSGELRSAKFGARIGWRIRRADYDDLLLRRQLTGAIASLLFGRNASAEPQS